MKTAISLGNSQRPETVARLQALAKRRPKSLQMIETQYSAHFLAWVLAICTDAIQQNRKCSRRSALRAAEQQGFRLVTAHDGSGEPCCMRCKRQTPLAGVIDRAFPQRILIYFMCEECRQKIGGDSAAEAYALRREQKIYGGQK